MKGGIKKFQAVLAVAFACVYMWGCGDLLREDGEKEFTGHYVKGNANVIGFIDDSLVIVYDFQYWNQDLANGSQITGTGKQRLRVFNYRIQEDGPRWADTLDNMTEVYDYVKGQLSDSVIWGGNSRTSFSFWKLGEVPIVRGVRVNKEGCDMDYGVRSLRPWLNETIIALGENSLKNSGSACQYAILDTVANTLTYKRLDANLKWIEKCDDVRAWGDDVYCSIPGEHSLEGNVIKNQSDTLLAPLAFSRGIFWGNMIELRANICSFDNRKIMCLDSAFSWREPLKFYKKDDVVVYLE